METPFHRRIDGALVSLDKAGLAHIVAV